MQDLNSLSVNDLEDHLFRLKHQVGAYERSDLTIDLESPIYIWLKERVRTVEMELFERTVLMNS